VRELQRRLARAGGAARAQLLLTSALGLLATLLMVAQATLLAAVIAEAFLDHASLAELTPKLTWLVAIALARGLVAFGFEATGRIGAARVMVELRRRLVDRLLLARPGGLAEERRGELAAAAVQGVDGLEAYYARYLPQLVLAALAPPVILAWVLPRDWEAAAILAVTFPLIPVFMVLIGRLAERSVQKRWRTLAALSAGFLDIVSGLETLRAFGRAEAQERSIASTSDRYRRETIATLRVGFLSALVLELFAMIGIALVAATIGLQLARGSLGLEAGLTVLILAPELYMPLRRLGAQFHAGAEGLAGAERIFEFLDLPPAVSVPASPEPAPDPARSAIRLEEVSFAYASRPQPVLDGASLELRPGESVALVGPSGTGKSTLAALLLRLADPSSGAVTCGGVDLRRVEPREWRSRVAWIPQRPTIFAATAAENIRLHDPGASDHRLREAARAANALEFIESLPAGFETQLGEGGRRLSFGQAQRLALARAFLRNPALVVLDEPTAHLDPEGAGVVWEAIARLARERTALVISHRASLVREASRIVELRSGRLRELPRATEGAPG
jgi:thiol reductant ABC exporter CydD subunit